MKRLLTASALALAACASEAPKAPAASVASASALQGPSDLSPETLKAIGAMCGAERLGVSSGRASLKLSDGFGEATWAADTTSKDAQAWFDFGWRLSDGFNHEDAKAAMRKAVEADPQCAMCAFGLAWALGPTLNYGFEDVDRDAARAAAAKARALAKDDKAKALAEAVAARYAKDDEPAFGRAMLAIAERYPDDAQLSVSAAHALLIPVRAGEKSGLKPALGLLERVLKTRPNDTGAIHYLIHATEFDGQAAAALPYALKLGRLAPKASHLVHMPAHTMIHAGFYEQAALVNAEAIEADAKWIATGGDPRGPSKAGRAASWSGMTPLYYAHNLGFGLAGALMAGDAKLSLKFADNAKLIWSNAAAVRGGTPVARTYVALARHAPERALALPELKEPKLMLYRHYARGEALMLKGDVAGVTAEAKAIAAMKNAAATSPEGQIARDVLLGRAAMAAGRYAEAARLFGQAAGVQEAKFADSWDPPAWWYPVRRSAAAAWLKARDFEKAKAEAQASLGSWKLDPLALWVLGQAEIGLGDRTSGEAHLKQARDIWKGDFSSIVAEMI